MKSQVHNIDIELTVILGRCQLPMHQLLKMGRGAIIPLGAGESEQVWILANNHPIARGDIVIAGDRLTVVVTEPADVHAFNAAA
ncbi:MAG: FliM/FliN family flagellar motor switch protein [Alphaproteobacteria bacterium]|nr:FliM/FliN family flagellar motor switch protein [Alphaproteobacteria bacterium]